MKTDNELYEEVVSQARERRALSARFGAESVYDLDVAQLVEALDDEDLAVRRGAVHQLGDKSGFDDVACTALEKAAHSTDESLCDAATVQLHSPADLLDVLVEELIGIGQRDGFVGAPGTTFDEHWNHKRARRIGTMLDECGGLEMMRQAHARIGAKFPGSARARELEASWGGVGDWRA